MAMKEMIRLSRAFARGRSSLFPCRGCATEASSSSPSNVTRKEIPEHLYHKEADSTLESLQERLEEYVESLDLVEGDVEYGMGVLTLKLGEKGTYVINKQAPNRQIWSSSPLSGPVRYDLVHGKWIYARDGHELVERLSKELEQMFGTTFRKD